MGILVKHKNNLVSMDLIYLSKMKPLLNSCHAPEMTSVYKMKKTLHSRKRCHSTNCDLKNKTNLYKIKEETPLKFPGQYGIFQKEHGTGYQNVLPLTLAILIQFLFIHSTKSYCVPLGLAARLGCGLCRRQTSNK